jgi:ABC-type thiamine transport system substrate-binding protein
MNLILRFLKNKSGASESIGFLATILLLVLVILNLYSPIKYVMQELVVENIHRLALMEMEQEGGFTTDLENKTMDRLKAFGLDESKITITSPTPQPVQWGDEIQLTIKYDTDYTSFNFASFALGKTSETKTIEVTRSSVSREYFK